MDSIVKKYFLINDLPVQVLMTQDNIAIQLWSPDVLRGTMKRDYSLLLDIVDGRHNGEIDETAFMNFCKDNNVSTEISGTVRAFNKANAGLGLLKMPRSLISTVVGSRNSLAFN